MAATAPVRWVVGPRGQEMHRVLWGGGRRLNQDHPFNDDLNTIVLEELLAGGREANRGQVLRANTNI